MNIASLNTVASSEEMARINSIGNQFTQTAQLMQKFGSLFQTAASTPFTPLTKAELEYLSSPAYQQYLEIAKLIGQIQPPITKNVDDMN